MESLQSHEIRKLRKKILLQLNWGEVASWHSKMYEELSDRIFEKSGVMLSVTTLKRFFGSVNHAGAPSASTLDALSQFCGSENWRAFKLANRDKRWKVSSPSKTVYVTFGFLLAIVTVSLLSNRRPDLVIDASAFSFSSRVLSHEYPNSVIFDFHIPVSISADTFKIQQYWDPTKTIFVRKEQQKATGIYYFPGYFKAKLLVDKKVALEHDLFLKSNGWIGSVEYDPIPKYFLPITKPNRLSYPLEITDEVENLTNPLYTTFHFVDDLGPVSGDNFTLTTTLQNVFDERWAVCQKTRIYILSTQGAMIIPFSKIGCSSDNNLMLNDVYLSGKENDLSSLSADFSEPKEIEILVRDNTMQVYVQGQQVFKGQYMEPMGKLVGLRFRFEGLGEVLDYQLKDQNDEIIEL